MKKRAKKKQGPEMDRLSAKYLDMLASFGISPEELPEDLKGHPVRISQVNFDVPLEKKVQAKMGPPPYAVRAKMVEDLTDKLYAELDKQWKKAARELEDDPETFSRVWKAVVETLELDRLNELIKEHNTYYPIEANLQHDPETGQIMIGATPWKPKKRITHKDLLHKFPPDLEKAAK